jgi:C4-dicarboxylate transporter DctM subunit
MDQVVVSLLLVGLLFLLLGAGIWVAFALMGVGFIAMSVLTSTPVGKTMAITVWGSSYSWELAALPMFIWIGEILFRSRLSQDMFSGISPWVSRLPGRLLHVNILGCGIFAAVSGSSAATTATIGKIALPQLFERKYDERMVIGTLAGSGTLGLLIPPSIILIVYGAATEESIARLFIAGVLPGLMLVLLFMGYVVVWSLLFPRKVPPRDPPLPFRQRLYASRRLLPVLAMILAVIGSIYTGIASPTDAAAVGVFLSLVISRLQGTLSWKTFIEGVAGATKMSCMIAFILAGAGFMSIAMGFVGLPAALAQWIASLGLSVYSLILVLTLFFVILGCFLDGISIVVLTTAIILPMVDQVGIDRVWFGIYLVLVVEMSQITPPVGFNLFVIQALTKKNIFYIALCALPFFLVLVLAVALLVLFPEIATYLPQKMSGRL